MQDRFTALRIVERGRKQEEAWEILHEEHHDLFSSQNNNCDDLIKDEMGGHVAYMGLMSCTYKVFGWKIRREETTLKTTVVGWIYFPPDRDWCRDLGFWATLSFLRRALLHTVNSYKAIERRHSCILFWRFIIQNFFS